MKIVFLCGSLEPGRDGVGDYTRRLARYLVTKGHQVNLVALNDNYVNCMFDGVQTEENIELNTLRLPACWKIKDRIDQAKIWIDVAEPDWLSLQYVIFSFHNKGLPIAFHKHLQHWNKQYNWHIMFHELWIGMGINDSIRRKLWGRLQKILIGRLIKKLHPKMIHTHCQLFFEKLKNGRITIEKLPLFSNIDVCDSSVGTNNQLQYESFCEHTIKLVFFGGLYPGSKMKELIQEIKLFERTSASTHEFWYLGINGQELDKHTALLDRENIKYRIFGELASENISYLLSHASYGVTTGSPQMIEKNGTVASMIAHRLPVICIGKEMALKKGSLSNRLEGVYFMYDLPEIFASRPDVEPYNMIFDVADKYIHDLELHQTYI